MTLGLPRVIGHRGVAAEAPENTLAGLTEAARRGFRWVEFDVMLTRDDVAVLHHDDRLGRTSSGTGAMAETAYAEVARLDAGSWFAPSFAGEPIPAFEAAILRCRGLGLGMNVEIKPTAGRERATAMAVADMLSRTCADYAHSIVVSSFKTACLEIMRDMAPAFRRGFLCEALPDNWRQTAEGLACFSVHPSHRHLTEGQVAAIREAGMRVLPYTVNDQARAATILSWGADSVITDEPSVLDGFA